jgi:hypothetical protein
VNGLTQPLTVTRIEYVPAGIVPPNILGPRFPNKKYFGIRSVFCRMSFVSLKRPRYNAIETFLDVTTHGITASMLVYPHGGGFVIFKPFVIGVTHRLLDALYKFHVIGQAGVGLPVGDDRGAKLGIGLGKIEIDGDRAAGQNSAGGGTTSVWIQHAHNLFAKRKVA